jgi:hypothetical protein
MSAPSPTPEPTPDSAPAPEPKWYEQAFASDPDLASSPSVQRYETLREFARSKLELEKKLGTKRLEAPQESWTPEQWSKFYGEIGRPESPDAYSAKLEIPEGLPWDAEGEKAMRAVFHEAGLTDAQASKVLTAYLEHQSGVWNGYNEQVAQQRAQAESSLRKEWGAAYDGNVRRAEAAWKAALPEGDRAAMAELKLSDGTLMGNHPLFLKAFAALGGKMAEHNLLKGGGPVSESPDAAKEKLAALMGDESFQKKLLDPTHPQHKEAVEQRSRLMRLIHPEDKA